MVTTYTHTRCGGNLKPIADPPWFQRPRFAGGSHLRWIIFARCDRCHLEGEIAQ